MPCFEEALPGAVKEGHRGEIGLQTAIGQALRMFYEKMPSAVKRQHVTSAREGIRKGITSSPTEGFIDIASACSGSEIVYMCLEVMLSFLFCSILGISAKVRHVVCCEKDPDKQKFSTSQFRPLHANVANRVLDHDSIGRPLACNNEGSVSMHVSAIWQQC